MHFFIIHSANVVSSTLSWEFSKMMRRLFFGLPSRWHRNTSQVVKKVIHMKTIYNFLIKFLIQLNILDRFLIQLSQVISKKQSDGDIILWCYDDDGLFLWDGWPTNSPEAVFPKEAIVSKTHLYDFLASRGENRFGISKTASEMLLLHYGVFASYICLIFFYSRIQRIRRIFCLQEPLQSNFLPKGIYFWLDVVLVFEIGLIPTLLSTNSHSVSSV